MCPMNLAWISLAALALAVALSMFTSVNVGVVSLVLAWIVGVYLGGLRPADVIAGFPVQLFVTLVGVMLVFQMAQVNGTLERVAARAVRLCRGNAGLLPVMFFVVGLFLSAIGPGNIGGLALLAPMAMAAGGRAAVPPFLMAIMVGSGVQAGALSPFAPTGVIVNGIMARIGLAGLEWRTFSSNMFAHSVVALAGYSLFGGWGLLRRTAPPPEAATPVAAPGPMEARHQVTLVVLGALILGVIAFDMHVGMAALAGATVLSLAGVSDEREAIRRMPWSVVLMVCGVTVLIGVMEKTQGLELFTDLLARMSTPGNVTAVIALVIGLVSVYSSTSGVVLPAFLPTVPGLVERIGGGDAFAIASSMNVGGHLVDLSPLSTLGALILASLPAQADARTLFNQLLAWGLSMTVVGAIVCWVFFR
jgi:Na+/H+ antiporter NhaD/arsenite permease-like protein